MKSFFQFLIFFTIFGLVYFFTHYYVYLVIKRYQLFPQSQLIYVKYVFLFSALLLIASMFISRFFLIPFVSKALMDYSFFWLGLIVTAFFAFLFSQLLLFLLPYPKVILKSAVIVIIIIAGISIYYGSRFPVLKPIQLNFSKSNCPIHHLRIIQVSDLHLNNFSNLNRLKKVVNLINENKPDLILFTGDLLDQTILEPQPFQAVLKELHAHVGKYAIHGNHEFYAGIDFSDAFIKNSDITLLTNQLVLPHEAIELIGIDDRNSQNYLSNNLIPQLNNQSKPENKFRILLNHKPTLFLEAAEKGIDLQLSGHTHNGQFFPFNVLVRLFFRFKYGLYQHQDAVLYTSCGSGTWGPPWRLFSSSEIVLFDITIKNKD